MPCCGNQRHQSIAQNHQPGESTASSPTQQRIVRDTLVYFEYTGKTTLTVMGPVTGRRYRFDAPGTIIAVDQMDRVAVAAIPNLKQVRNPYTAGSI